MTRRDGLKAAALTAASYSRILGANDRAQMGLIGAGGRGQYVMTCFQKTSQVDVRAICDVYGQRIDEALAKAPGAKSFYQHERLLEVKEIDVVLVGTPDHWHKQVAIDALNAGKDVYVEKPLTRLPREGPEIVRAARVNERICQVGMQQRSGPVYLEALERFFKSGLIGKVTHVDCVWHSGPAGGSGRRQIAGMPKPSNLDWVRYLGPVKYRDWNPPQYFNFRGFLDFGGGKMTDFGAHWIDVGHMFMGQDAPLSVCAAGGLFRTYQDGRTAPDTISALYEYPGNFTLAFSSVAVGGTEYHVEFLGDGGRLWINRNRYEFYPAQKGAAPIVQKFPGDCTDDHVRNFLECCRTRKLPNADVYIGHRASQAALLGVQSYVERRRIRFDPVSEEVAPLSD